MNKLVKTNRGGYGHLDVLKIVLAYLVVIRHFAQGLPSDSLGFILIVNVISPVAVPMFFMISGFLAQKGSEKEQIPLDRIKRQCLRVLKLYIAWSIVFLPLDVLHIIRSNMSIERAILWYAQQFFFCGTWFQLWFLPSLIVGLLFVWLLRQRLDINIVLVISVLLFLFGLLDNSWRGVCPNLLSAFFDKYNQVFITTRNGIFFAPLFLCLGEKAALSKSEISRPVLWLCILIGFAANILEGFFTSYKSVGNVNDMLLSDAVVCTGLLLLLISKSKPHPALREDSTFIYCFHPIALMGVELLLGSTSKVVQCVCVVIISALCAWIIRVLKEKLVFLKLLY